jgi:hypothetical protein
MPCSAQGINALSESSSPPEYDRSANDELDSDEEDGEDDFSDSYAEEDIAMFERMGGRDADLTMPLETAAELDNSMRAIVGVLRAL